MLTWRNMLCVSRTLICCMRICFSLISRTNLFICEIFMTASHAEGSELMLCYLTALIASCGGIYFPARAHLCAGWVVLFY